MEEAGYTRDGGERIGVEAVQVQVQGKCVDSRAVDLVETTVEEKARMAAEKKLQAATTRFENYIYTILEQHERIDELKAKMVHFRPANYQEQLVRPQKVVSRSVSLRC